LHTRTYPHHSYPHQAESEQTYRPQRRRALILGRLALVALILIALRLGEIQLARAKYYLHTIAPQVTAQPRTGMAVPGSLLARDGTVLAQSIYSYTLIADAVGMAREKEPFAGVAHQLAGIIDKDENDIRATLEAHQNRKYILLQQWLEAEQVPAIREADVCGITLEPSYKRHYPNGTLACHLLGARNQFHIPLCGLEHRYRLLLDGKPSAVGSVTDSSGSPTLGGEDETLPPVAGFDIMLTLDVGLQRYVEARMDALCKRESPKNACAVVMKPSSGEILAMCSRPKFDPDILAEGADADPAARMAFKQEYACNVAVERNFAPGSTFKILLAAAALEAGIDPNRRFSCPGHYDAGGQPITCWGRYGTQGHGQVNMERMVAMSCNIAAAKIALELGPQQYITFLRKAGIGTPPHAGFPGETAGLLPDPETLSRRDLAVLGFGQRVSASALQTTAAAAAIANGGIKLHPHIVAAVLNKDGTVFRQPDLPEPVSVCSRATAQAVLKMMVAAVDYGTAHTAAIEGVEVGAKTGTGQIWNPHTHTFYADKYLTSFLLICPADNPEFVVYVAALEPQVGQHGADVAGPTAREIASFALRQVTNP